MPPPHPELVKALTGIQGSLSALEKRPSFEPLDVDLLVNSIDEVVPGPIDTTALGEALAESVPRLDTGALIVGLADVVPDNGGQLAAITTQLQAMDIADRKDASSLVNGIGQLDSTARKDTTLIVQAIEGIPPPPDSTPAIEALTQQVDTHSLYVGFGLVGLTVILGAAVWFRRCDRAPPPEPVYRPGPQQLAAMQNTPEPMGSGYGATSPTPPPPRRQRSAEKPPEDDKWAN